MKIVEDLGLNRTQTSELLVLIKTCRADHNPAIEACISIILCSCCWHLQFAKPKAISQNPEPAAPSTSSIGNYKELPVWCYKDGCLV